MSTLQPTELRTAAVPAWRFTVLLAAALVVSMSYGVTLPLLPGMLEGRLPADAVASHTGWLTGVYTLGLLLFSPLWGALSDRVDRRTVIAAGLVGSAVALWALDLAAGLPGLYVARAAAGTLAAAVLPAVFASTVELTPPERRQMRFAWLATASSLGFLLGPVVGNLLVHMLRPAGGRPMLDSPFAVVAYLCVAAAAATYALPAIRASAPAAEGAGRADEGAIRRALPFSALVVLAITVAEVGLTLIGREGKGVRTEQIVWYFGLCSAVMVVVQVWIYPRLERWCGEPRLVAWSFGTMAAGVALLAWPHLAWGAAAAFLLAGAAVGVLVPALALRISLAGGSRQGWALGRQAAASNLGQAIGAAATGMLYAAAQWLPFVAAAALSAAAAFALRPHAHR